MAPAGELVKFSLQRVCDRTGLPIADGAEVDLPQADDFGGGAADENFIGDVKLVAGNRLFDYCVPKVSRQRQQAVARDAFENGSRAGV